MQVHSLGYRTDLIFPRFDGLILDRGEYLVVRTPSNPTFYWGNFLLFSDPPGEGDLENWKAVFTREIGTPAQVRHFAFGWDSPGGETGVVQPFREAGFNLSQSIVLTARQVNLPPKVNREVIIRPLSQDWEWQQAEEDQVACREPEHSLEGYRVFKHNQMERYRRMSQAGLGHWFGAFLGDRLVADLGLFVDLSHSVGEELVGRFQSVETHPDFRRQGICGTLVQHASGYAFEKMGVETLVMVADEHYFAAKIYESVGFRPTERQVGVDWWEKKDD
jgi:ribosomal protein S18 acetylase RimI-like enzyme